MVRAPSRILRRYLLRVLTEPRRKVAINLDVEYPTLWLENEAGEKFVPDLGDWQGVPKDLKGFNYQHSAFPSTLVHTCLQLITEEDVKACAHTETVVDHGLIEGLEGRICRDCGGTQTKNVGAPWPSEWTSGGSRSLYSGSSTYPTDLVLAMTRPTQAEIVKARERGHVITPVKFDRAVMLAANSCERCLNVLLWRHGLDDGYEEHSPEWKRCNTVCDLCRVSANRAMTSSTSSRITAHDPCR